MIKIPTPIMPTEDELRASSARWLAHLAPCLYENWPEALKSLSFPTDLITLSHAEIDDVLAMADGKRGPNLATLAARIDESLALHPPGCFAKLSSRSPKDLWWEGPTRFNPGEGMAVVLKLGGSMRTFDDLCEYQHADAPCHILLREYREIPKHEEFRCFIRESQIAAVSQYHYRETFAELADPTWRERCFHFLEDTIIPHIPVPTIVVDLWMKDEPLLIELNPYGLSDPCLFKYAEIEGAFGQYRTL